MFRPRQDVLDPVHFPEKFPRGTENNKRARQEKKKKDSPLGRAGDDNEATLVIIPDSVVTFFRLIFFSIEGKARGVLGAARRCSAKSCLCYLTPE